MPSIFLWSSFLSFRLFLSFGDSIQKNHWNISIFPAYFYPHHSTIMPYLAPLAHCHYPVLAYMWCFNLPFNNAVKLCCIVHHPETLPTSSIEVKQDLAEIKSRKDLNRNIGIPGFRQKWEGGKSFSLLVQDFFLFIPQIGRSHGKGEWSAGLRQWPECMFPIKSVIPTIKTGGKVSGRQAKSFPTKINRLCSRSVPLDFRSYRTKRRGWSWTVNYAQLPL